VSQKQLHSAPAQLTSMVNFWPDQPIFSEQLTDQEREIHGGPIFKLSEVQKSLKPESIRLVTGKTARDVAEKLEWEIEHVWRAIVHLQAKHFHRSEWCLTGSKIWLRTDSYVMRRYDDNLDPIRPVDLYVKFGVSNNGSLLLIVSCHPCE